MTRLFAFFLIILLLPIILLIILLSGLFNNFKVFYISDRFVSLNRSIKIYKFMSMHYDINEIYPHLFDDYNQGGFLKIPLSLKIYTPIGIAIEYLEFVEILQLINIIKGDMRFVGNRPLPIKNLRLISQFKGYEKRFLCPAGITGIAQLAWKLKPDVKERIKLECAYSSMYVNGVHKLLDIKIIIATIIYLTTRNTWLIINIKNKLL